MPNCDLSTKEIAAAIEQVSVQHSFLGLALRKRAP
jgi:hypothetical protein